MEKQNKAPASIIIIFILNFLLIIVSGFFCLLMLSFTGITTYALLFIIPILMIIFGIGFLKGKHWAKVLGVTVYILWSTFVLYTSNPIFAVPSIICLIILASSRKAREYLSN